MTIAEFFQANQRWVSASAPGRLDVMGGLADFAGSLVLQMPLRERATVLAGFRGDDWVRVHSEDFDATFTLNLAPFRRVLNPFEAYRLASDAIFLQKNGPWAAPVVGCLLALCFENRLFFRGIDFYVSSNVPSGAGVSAMAAIQVATLRALEQLYGLTLNNTLLPRLAQAAEQYIVGRPSGGADQFAAHFGVSGRLLPIVCQPDRVFEAMPEVPGLRFFGIEIGHRTPKNKGFQPSAYEGYRAASFMGYSLLAETQGVGAKTLLGIRMGSGRPNLPWSGWLCNINKQYFEEKMSDTLPMSMSGAEFSERCGRTIDEIATIDPEKNYAVRPCTAYPIFENARVRGFYQLYSAAVGEVLAQNPLFRRQFLGQMGQLMHESHGAYATCGLGHPDADWLAQAAAELGPDSEIYGTKLSGRGSGGTVCVMAYGEQGEASVREIWERYCAFCGQEVHFFRPA